MDTFKNWLLRKLLSALRKFKFPEVNLQSTFSGRRDLLQPFAEALAICDALDGRGLGKWKKQVRDAMAFASTPGEVLIAAGVNLRELLEAGLALPRDLAERIENYILAAERQEFIETIKARQRNIVFPDTTRNNLPVVMFLRKGAAHLTAVRRIGAWAWGLLYAV